MKTLRAIISYSMVTLDFESRPYCAGVNYMIFCALKRKHSVLSEYLE